MGKFAKDFIGVELFKAGTWKDSKGKVNTWKESDLDGIVAAYEEIKESYHAPLKLGHDNKQRLLTDEPAIGWVENLRRKGTTLIGDFKKVPDKLAKVIEEGGYRARSIEVRPDFEVEGKKFPWALTGVALLGNTLPAISGLKDIVALYEKEGIEHEEHIEVILFEGSEGEDEEDLDVLLEDVLGKLNARIKGKRGAPHIRALQTALKNSIHATKGRSDNEMDKAKLIKLLSLEDDASDEDIEKAIGKLKTSNHEEEKPKTDPKPDENKSELSEYQGKVIQLEQRLALRDAEAVVGKAIEAGKLLPAQKEFAMKMAIRDITEFSSFIETQPKVIEYGENGSTKDTPSDFAKFAPNQVDIEAAHAMGIDTNDEEWKLSIMKTKASFEGIVIPSSFGKKEEAAATK